MLAAETGSTDIISLYMRELPFDRIGVPFPALVEKAAGHRSEAMARHLRLVIPSRRRAALMVLSEIGRASDRTHKHVWGDPKREGNRWLALVPVYGAQECADLVGLDDRGMMFDLGRDQGALEIGGHISLRPSGGDRVANDAAAGAAEAS